MPDSTETTQAAPRDVEDTRPPGLPRWLKVSAIVTLVVIAIALLVMAVGGHSPGGHGPSRHTGSFGATSIQAA